MDRSLHRRYYHPANATAQGLTVTVRFAGDGVTPSCVTSDPVLNVSPSNQSVTAGRATTYSVALMNRDSAACSPRVFNMAAVGPAGWGSVVTPAVVTAAAGATASLTLTESVPSDAQPGTSTISLSATSGPSVANAVANLTVVAPPPACIAAAPSVTVTPAILSVAPGGSVSYTVAVKNNNSTECSPAAMNLSSSLPTGWSTTITPTSLTLASGQTAAATVNKAAPLTATASTYACGIAATSGTSAATASATCTVTIPPPPPPSSCIAREAAVSMSPGNLTAADGASITYTMSITNNDSAACTATAFGVSSPQPALWGSTISPQSITLQPGQSGSVVLAKTIPRGTAAGSYQVTGTVSHGSFTRHAAATCSVTNQPPPAPALTVTTSVSAASYPVRSSVPIRALVKKNASPVAGAIVVFTIRRPNGTQESGSVASNSDGAGLWFYRPNQRGSYSFSARTVVGGVTAMSDTASFAVY